MFPQPWRHHLLTDLISKGILMRSREPRAIKTGLGGLVLGCFAGGRGGGGFFPPLWQRTLPDPRTLLSQRVVFCQLKEALAVDWSGEKAKAALKRTTPDYFLLQGKSLPFNSTAFPCQQWEIRLQLVTAPGMCSPPFLSNCQQPFGCTPAPERRQRSDSLSPLSPSAVEVSYR